MFDAESVREYPVIISEDVVFFPFTAGILSIKHPKSVEAIQKVLREHPQEPQVVLCTKKNSTSRRKDLKLFSIGTLCRVTNSVFYSMNVKSYWKGWNVCVSKSSKRTLLSRERLPL